MSRLLAAVIPSESREHVLGDLAERGNRWWDILTILRGVWWSAILRLYTAPTPSFDGATEETFQLRNRQFLRESSRNWQLTFGLLSLLSYPILGTPAILLPVAALLLLMRWRSARQRSAPPLDSGKGSVTWRQHHVSALARHLLVPSFSFVVPLDLRYTFYGWSVREFFTFSPPNLTVTPSFLLGEYAMLTLMVLLNLPFAVRIYRECRAFNAAPGLFFPEVLWAGLPPFLTIGLNYSRHLVSDPVWRLMPHVPDEVLLFLGPSVIFLGLALFIAIAFRKYLHSLKTGREREAEFWSTK